MKIKDLIKEETGEPIGRYYKYRLYRKFANEGIGYEEAKKHLKDIYGVDSSGDLELEQFKQVIGQLELMRRARTSETEEKKLPANE